MFLRDPWPDGAESFARNRHDITPVAVAPPLNVKSFRRRGPVHRRPRRAHDIDDSMLSDFRSASQRIFEFARPVAAPPGRPAWHVREEAIMGTAIRVELWSDDDAASRAATAAVMREMHRIDHAMSPHKPASELARINREAARRAVPLSEEMCRLLARAIDFSDLTDGAFDITYASAGHLYDYRAGVLPTPAALDRALAGIGWRHLELDAHAGTLRFAHPATRIDLGGFAKGHAVDSAARLLAARGIVHANISAGGDSRVIGDRRGRPWTIGIRDPRRAGEIVAVLPLEDTSISTSGDYERYFERDGERHHHVIDPRTGRSAHAARSVTVLAHDGLNCEALSKAVFVLGPSEGLALIERLPGIDAVVIDTDGALHCSSGFLGAAPAPCTI
jgi:FAD:protein FMN transferase